MPEDYKFIYGKMSESQKLLLSQQASTRTLASKKDVEEFWNSRNFNAIMESSSQITLTESYSNDPLAGIMKMLQ